MAEKMVRCVRCHEVFNAEAGPCPKCGTPYRPPVTQPQAVDGLYVERYAGTPFASAPDAVPPAFLPRRNSTGLVIGAGVALLAAAVLVAIVAVIVGTGASPTAAPVRVVALTEPPTPEPSLPPSIALTLQQLNDPNLSADLVVESVADVNDPSLGKHDRHTVSFNGQIAGGNEAGIVKEAGTTKEYRLVDGVVYVRVPPATLWSTAASIPPYLVIDQSFGLSKPQMLALIGAETLDGQPVNHFRNTVSWIPDVARISMTDISGFAFKPDVVVLDLWTSPDGSPVKAVFSATNTATNGTKLLDMETTYTFANVGVPLQIGAPGPSPSGSSGPSPGS